MALLPEGVRLRDRLGKTKGSNETPAGNWEPIRLVSPAELPAWDASLGLLHVVVDTPKGSPIKFKYDTGKRAYTISHVLPPGTVFPFDFAIPQTLAEDGDRLDVLILIEEPTFAGCLVSVRLVGVLQAEQTQEEGKTNRNDRLIAAAEASRTYRDIRSLGSVPAHLLTEIEHFFVSYNKERGRKFYLVGRFGRKRARQLVKDGERRFRQSTKPTTRP
jgi:inorganic pyrophosphatase